MHFPNPMSTRHSRPWKGRERDKKLSEMRINDWPLVYTEYKLPMAQCGAIECVYECSSSCFKKIHFACN